MPRFIGLAKQSIPNFAGIKYTSGDLEHIAPCAGDSDIAIFIGSDPLLCSALAMGFDSSIMTTLNICPEISQDILSAMKNGDLVRGKERQKELTMRVHEILKKGKSFLANLQEICLKSIFLGPWVPAMKLEFNQIMKSRGLSAGNVRFPLKNAK